MLIFLPVGSLCGQVRKKHPWGDAKATKVQNIAINKALGFFWLCELYSELPHILLIQDEIEKRLAEILGPKTEADNVKPVKKKKEKPAKVEVGKLKWTLRLKFSDLIIVIFELACVLSVKRRRKKLQ
jgi:hypothetical protein